MTAPAGLVRRLSRLEAAEPATGAPAIVIYLTTDTEEERQARAPAGAGFVLFLPYNGRDPDRHPGPPPALKR